MEEDPKKEEEIVIEEIPTEEEKIEETQEEPFSPEGEISTSPEIEEHQSIIEESKIAIEETQTTPSDPVVPGYYGDIVIDGNGVVETQESQILPVNANKKGSFIDESSKVFINPTRL